MGNKLVLAGLCALLPAYGAIVVTVSPSPASVHVGTFLQFSAKVTGTSTTGVVWSVVPAIGSGSIDTGGRYTPPASLVGIVTVIATSTASPAASASVTVAIQNPYPTVASVIPSSVPVGPFSITVNGSGFVPGAQVLYGGKPMITTYLSPTRLAASFTSLPAEKGSTIPIIVKNPDPGSATSTDVVGVAVGPISGTHTLSANIAAHFMDQAAFGPDFITLDHLETIGLEAYLKEQFAAPISPYPDPATTGFGLAQVQARFFTNAVHGQDQLRQRVAFALGQIMVASAIEESTPTQLVPFLGILQKDSFANFRTLMEDVTLSPTMGEYLDMRNNDKANPATDTRANENYARELMQLFTIGLSQLNLDGTLKLDANGNAIPTYDQTTIQNFAKVYTGWTYPTKPGATVQKHNPAYFNGPMVPFESNHDTTSKTLLNGLVLPAGQTAEQDLEAALDNIFNHPNVGPFIGKQLIQHLVGSNPSPAYVARIASVFNDNGSGVRGDMQAVIRAILLDPEARQGDNGPFDKGPDSPPSAHLREPVFIVASILRGLGAFVNDTNNLTAQATNLGQVLFSPPSVFNYYAPGYQVPADLTKGTVLLGPEFQLDSPSNAVARFNMVNTMIYGSLGNGASIDVTPFANLGPRPPDLVDAISQVFMDGQMPLDVQTALLEAINANTGTSAAVNKARAQAAIYLTVSSSYYNVEH